jgi:inner membrane protein
MMSEVITMNSSWFWFILAGLLLIGELLSPGVFLMWLAGAAVITGLVELVLGMAWTSELLVFGLASLLVVLLSWKFVSRGWNPKSDQPYLNQRHGAYVGQIFVLEQAIVNGSGTLRIEDALWNVDGPDLAVGTRVKVKGVNGLRLMAERA